jgi:hypothetical protein
MQERRKRERYQSKISIPVKKKGDSSFLHVRGANAQNTQAQEYVHEKKQNGNWGYRPSSSSHNIQPRK